MESFLGLVAFVLVLTVDGPPVLCRPQASPNTTSSSTPIPIVSSTSWTGAGGSFNYSFQTGNGIAIAQAGYTRQVNAPRSGNGSAVEEDILVLQGAYTYTAPDGEVIHIEYTADENGYHPEGDAIPTSPPFPQGLLQTIGANTTTNANEFPKSFYPETVPVIQSLSTTIQPHPVYRPEPPRH